MVIKFYSLGSTLYTQLWSCGRGQIYQRKLQGRGEGTALAPCRGASTRGTHGGGGGTGGPG